MQGEEDDVGTARKLTDAERKVWHAAWQKAHHDEILAQRAQYRARQKEKLQAQRAAGNAAAKKARAQQAA